MAHIFNDFIKEEIHVAEVKVEKDTKKAVKETIDTLENLVKQESSIHVLVDATVLNKEELIASLVAFSLYEYRNLSFAHLQFIQIKLHEDYVRISFTDEDKELFSQLKRRGGKREEYLRLEGVDWATMNSIIIQEMEHVLNEIKRINAQYEEVIAQTSNPSAPLQYKRQFNFQRFSTNLLSLYRRCFNEMDQLLHPSMTYNPNPSFQRDLVWDVEKKRSFIRSILNDIPIGAFYVNVSKTYDPKLELAEGHGGLVWDGKQRLHALHSFFLGEFDVEVDGNRYYYQEASRFFNIAFESCGISVYESEFDDLKSIIEAYVIINSAQVKHTDEDLDKAIRYLESQTVQS